MEKELREQYAKALVGGREARRMPTQGVELREQGGSLMLSGIASVTNRAYDMGWYQETIRSGAFKKTLDEKPDVQLLINHEGLPLARTLSSTLTLLEVDQGLSVNAVLNPNDPDVQRLAPKVERGDIDQMSFGFRVVRQDWDEDYTDRQISEVNLHRGDVSVVNQGANPFTSFNMRSDQLVDALVEVRSGKVSDNALAILSEILSKTSDAESVDLRSRLISDEAVEEIIEETEQVARTFSLDTAKAIAMASRLKQSRR